MSQFRLQRVIVSVNVSTGFNNVKVSVSTCITIQEEYSYLATLCPFTTTLMFLGIYR